MCIDRSTPGSGSNISGSSLRSSPIAPISVRSVPREICTSSPAARILASTAAISASPASGSITMIICRSFVHVLQKRSGGLFGAARFAFCRSLLLMPTVARAPRWDPDKNRRTQTPSRTATADRRGVTRYSLRGAYHDWERDCFPRLFLLKRERRTRVLAPFFDLALDRLRHVRAEELANVLVDRGDQIRARAIDNRLQSLIQLVLETGIGKDVDSLQHLHANVFGECIPARGIVGNRSGLGHHRRRIDGRLLW